MNRVAAETEGLFAGIYPLCLLDALEAADTGDAETWAASGAERFATDLREVLAGIDALPDEAMRTDNGEHVPTKTVTSTEGPDEAAVTEITASAGTPVVPRRVRSGGVARSPRPAA